MHPILSKGSFIYYVSFCTREGGLGNAYFSTESKQKLTLGGRVQKATKTYCMNGPKIKEERRCWSTSTISISEEKLPCIILATFFVRICTIFQKGRASSRATFLLILLSFHKSLKVKSLMLKLKN